MKSVSTLFGMFFALTVIAACLYGCYLAISYTWDLYKELNSEVRLILLSSLAAIVVSSLIIAGAIKSSAHKNNESQLAGAKFQLYRSLVEIYRPIISSHEKPTQQMYSEMLTCLAEIESEMQILSAGTVLETRGKLERALRDTEEWDSIDDIYHDLIKNIRHDLGHVPSYMESKLNFLVRTTRVESSGRPDQGSGQ